MALLEAHSALPRLVHDNAKEMVTGTPSAVSKPEELQSSDLNNLRSDSDDTFGALPRRLRPSGFLTNPPLHLFSLLLLCSATLAGRSPSYSVSGFCSYAAAYNGFYEPMGSTASGVSKSEERIDAISSSEDEPAP